MHYHKEIIRTTSKFFKEDSAIFSIGEDNIEGTIKIDNEVRVIVNGLFIDDGDDNYSAKVKIGSAVFTINEVEMVTSNASLSHIDGHATSTFGLRKLFGGIHKKEAYSTIIRLSAKFQFSNYFDTYTYQSDLFHWSRNAVSIPFPDECIFVFEIKSEDENYLIIESILQQDRESFEDKVYRTQLIIGFITGYRPGDAALTFHTNTGESTWSSIFDYRSIWKTRNNLIEPINRNYYAYSRNEQYKKELLIVPSPLNQEQLAQFVDLLSNQYIEHAILQVIEVSSENLLLRVGVYYIVIEALKNYVKQQFVEVPSSNITTICDVDIFEKEVRNPCLLIVNEATLDNEKKEKLSNKLRNLNAPNNRDQLEAIFNRYDIRLSEEDVKTLNGRNLVLHGTSFRKHSITDEELSKDYFDASNRLFTLISLLILRMIGFNGLVLDWVKLSNLESKGSPMEFYRV